MTTLTSDEIENIGAYFPDDPHAQKALSAILTCDGSLEDAARFIVLDADAEGEISRFGLGLGPDFLANLASRCREVVCRKEFQDEFIVGWTREMLRMLVAAVSAHLAMTGSLPAALAIPVVMFVLKVRLRKFCEEAADLAKHPSS